MHDIAIDVDEAFADQADAALVERAVLAVLEIEGITTPTEVSVRVSDDDELHDLNREYRNVDRPTDVLSFAAEDDDDNGPQFVLPPDAPRYLGDIAISYERVLEQARDYGHSAARELAYLTAHGVLHLLGYDHELGEAEAAAMREREEAAMTLLGLPRQASGQ